MSTKHGDQGPDGAPITSGGESATIRAVIEQMKKLDDKKRDLLPAPYNFVRDLGEGGMGEVYLAEQTKPLKRTVAIKLIKLGMDSKAVIARFEAERQALALMNHSNVARVFDAGSTDQGRPYFVMEYVDGVPITKYCDDDCLTIEERLKLFMQVCEGVQHAHQKGIIHRDLKPSNVLVAVQDGKPVPKVIDFGLAKALDQRLIDSSMHTQHGQAVGTLPYMSPEQFEGVGANIDTRTDVYSLGVILYELLVGTLPHNPTTLAKAVHSEQLRILREVEPPKPSARCNTIDESATAIAKNRYAAVRRLRRKLRHDLDAITMKALEKRPDQRYPTAVDFGADIGRFLRGEPVSARPYSSFYVLQKLIRRHRTAMSAAAAFLILATAAAATITVLWRDAKRQELRTRELLARSYLDAIDRARHLGQWQDVLDAASLAQEIPPEFVTGTRFRKIEAWISLGQADRAAGELGSLAASVEGTSNEAEWLLWRAELAMTSKLESESVERLVGRALRLGTLRPEDEAYAQGLAAGNLKDALTHFQRAVEIDFFYERAHLMIAMISLTTGDFAQVKQRAWIAERSFPKDPSPLLLQALVCALQHDPQGANAFLDRIQSRLRLEDVAVLRFVVSVLDDVNRVEQLLEGDIKEHDRIIMRQLANFVPLVLTGMATSGATKAADVGDHQPVEIIARFPPALQRAVQEVVASVVARYIGGNSIDASEHLIKASELLPNGIFELLRGRTLYENGHYAEALEAFRNAASMPSLLECRGAALALIARTTWKLVENDGSDPTLRRDALVAIEERLRLSELFEAQYRDFVHISIAAGETGRAGYLLERWAERFPDSPDRLAARQRFVDLQ